MRNPAVITSFTISDVEFSRGKTITSAARHCASYRLKQTSKTLLFNNPYKIGKIKISEIYRSFYFLTKKQHLLDHCVQIKVR